MKPKLPAQMARRQFIALAGFGVLIIILNLAFFYFKNHTKPEPPDVEFITEEQTATPAILAEFNPNDLDKKQWTALGFTDKQASNILNYKNSLGGEFKTKAQLRKAYAFTAEKFAALEPYILLPDDEKSAETYKFKTFAKKELKIPGKFNPDHLSAAEWIAMGFTPNQSNAIF